MQSNELYEQMRIRLKPQSFTSGRPQEDRDTLSSHMTNKNLIPPPANRLPKSSATIASRLPTTTWDASGAHW